MRHIVVVAGLIVAGAASIGSAIAVPVMPNALGPRATMGARTEIAREAAGRESSARVLKVDRRLFRRVPTSAYHSYGYPRLYYYPYGLRPPQRRWRWW